MQEKIFNRRLETFLHLSIWSIFVSIYVIIFARFMPYEISFLRGLANVLPMAFLFYANIWLVDRFIERKHYIAFGFITICLFMGATFLRMKLNTLFPDIRRDMLGISPEEGWFFGALFTNFSFVVVGVFYQMLYNRYRTERRNLAIISEQKEAQLQALRSQINPHFLFNTLNNIYSLAVVKSDKTAGMVLKLSNLLRYVIYDGKTEQVELKREVEQIQEFIDLFQMRSEVPLNIQFEVLGTTQGIKIEPMILIPIVENCFKHCDFDTNDQAFIRITLSIQGGKLQFKTVNSKDDRNQQKDQVGGVGLNNINKRLELKYKEAFQLSVVGEKNVFEVNLVLNIEQKTNHIALN